MEENSMEEETTQTIPFEETTVETEEEGVSEATTDAEVEEVPVSVEDIVSGAKSKTPKGIQKRIDELTREKYEFKARAEAAEAAMSRPIDKTVSSDVPSNRPLPPRDLDFADPDEYVQARVKYEDDLDTWREKQKISSEKAAKMQLEEKEAYAKFNVDAERVRNKYADFDDVISKMPSSPNLSFEVLTSDYAPEIGYYLSKNPDIAIKLRDLPPSRIAREIGKLEARFGDANAKFISNAPAPIIPVEGSDVPPKDESAMSTKDWMALDKKRSLEKIKKRLGG